MDLGAGGPWEGWQIEEGGKESHSSQGRAPLDLCAVVMGRLVLCAVAGARQFVSGTSSRSIID